MESNRRERDKEVAVISSLERILRDGHQIAAVSSTATSAGDPLIALQSLKASLEEVAAPIREPRAKKRSIASR